jgi:uncharacterized membrane protein YeaQ/YmgE (transglycosylase-associated protein family)
VTYLVWVVLLGILAGWLAGQIIKGRGFGLLGDLVVGILELSVRCWAVSYSGWSGWAPTVCWADWLSL